MDNQQVQAAVEVRNDKNSDSNGTASKTSSKVITTPIKRKVRKKTRPMIAASTTLKWLKLIADVESMPYLETLAGNEPDELITDLYQFQRINITAPGARQQIQAAFQRQHGFDIPLDVIFEAHTTAMLVKAATGHYITCEETNLGPFTRYAMKASTLVRSWTFLKSFLSRTFLS